MLRANTRAAACIALLTTSSLVGTSVALAERPPSFDPADQTHELVIDLKTELPIVLISGAILGVSQFIGKAYGPKTCSWCETRDSLNGFDSLGMKALEGANRTQAGIASDVLGYGGMPILALGLGLASSLDATRGAPTRYRLRRYGIDVLLMTEAVATTLSVMNFVKFISNRRRPSAIDEPKDGERMVDQNLSFFSGHTALAFSLATSAGTIASLRKERLAPVVWVIGMLAATGTGISRVAANQHFASDVIVGSVVGAGIGIMVPMLHRFKSPVTVGGTASASAGLVNVSGRF